MDLRDITLPEPVGFWPPAPFAWILLGLFCIGLLYHIWKAILRWKAEAYRREGLARLSRIEAQFSKAGKKDFALQELSVLLKRVALAAFPRRKVAPLYGREWLLFLDETCSGCTFSKGPGQWLLSPDGTETKGRTTLSGDTPALLGLSRTWIKEHRIPGKTVCETQGRSEP